MSGRSALRRGLIVSAGVVALTGQPGAALAAETADDAAAVAQEDLAETSNETASGNEIVVTATRRNALLDEVPLSISVVSAESLQRDNITNIVDLNGRLPSLVIGASFGGARVAIRGIGFNPIRPGDEGRVAFYTDGVYIARPSAQVGTLFDVERIEVLRGPQGTLYGRNSTGGALLVTTRDPTREASGYINATIGTDELYQFSGALSGPLSDTLSARIAFQTVNRGGYWDNIVTGREVGNANTASVRATILWAPSSRFSLRVTGDTHREDDRNYVVHAIRPGVTVDPYGSLFGSRDIAQLYDPSNDVDSYGFSANARYEINDELTLSAVGGYRNFESNLFLVGTATRDFSAVSYFIDDSEQYNAELQLTGDHGRFSWITGASYFNESQNPTLRSALLGRAFSPVAPNSPVQGTWSTANLRTNAWAVFAEGTFNITDQLSITAGIRYSWERKQALEEISAIDLATPWSGPNAPDFGFVVVPARPGYPRDSSADFDAWTPKFAINYQFSPAVSAYLTYVEGFKSGGFNYGTAQDPYEPETIANYEVGLRTRLFSRMLTLRAAVFRYSYQNLQQTVQNQFPPGTFVLNTGSARIQGAEVEFILQPIEGLQVDGNASVLDTRFGTYSTVNPITLQVVDIGGNKVPQAPSYNFNLGVQYTATLAPGRLTLRGDYRRTGRTYFDIYETPFMIQPGYDVFGANLTFETADEHWRASLFVTNIGNTYAVNQLALQVPQLGGGAAGNLIPPRTFGLTVGYSF